MSRTDPDAFLPLQRPAREAIALVIDGRLSAHRLGEYGVGPCIASEIADQIRTERPSALNLFKLGLPGQVAMAIAQALNDKFAPAPVLEGPIKPSSSGAARGAAKPGKPWWGRAI